MLTSDQERTLDQLCVTAMEVSPPIAGGSVFARCRGDQFTYVVAPDGGFQKVDYQVDLGSPPDDHEHCRECGYCWQNRYPCPALMGSAP